MNMLFLLFGMAGFFLFFIWLIIAAIIKKPKKIPTIGFVLSTIVFVISVGISTSNDKSTSTRTEKNVIAGKSDNDEIKNSIDKNIVGLDKGNNYSIEIKKVESGGYSATVQLRAYSNTSSDACVNTAEHLIGGLINYQLTNFQKIKNLTLKFIDDSNNSLMFIIEANDTELITNKDSIRKNIILKDASGKNIHVKSEEELKKAKAEAEAKQKVEAEAKAKAEAEEKKKEINDFKISCKTIPYKDLARNPKNYIGKKILYTGKVIQVIESGNEIHLRVNVTKTQYIYEDAIYVVYAKYSSEGRILEDDIITIWGIANDLISYQSVLGQKITIPRVDARIVQVNVNN